jgi:hypothetical protein
MNFEQNFSPLDPNSEEYQSIGDEYLQISPSVGGETEKRKEEKPITLKDLGLQKPVSKKKEAGLNGLEAVKLEDKAILAAKQSQIELQDTYNSVVKGGTNYLNGIVEKIKQDKPEAQPLLSEFLREQALLNTPQQLKERVDKSWDFLSSVTDINDNYATRDAWINSQYAGAYYSKSKSIKEEYESSNLKDKISQKQYSGLRSLIYGKKADFNDFMNVLQDPEAKQADKDLVLAKLDKISSNIDIAAGSAMGKDGGKEGISLFNDGKLGAKESEDKLIQIEYDNPFTIQSFKDITGRAIERGMYSGEVADMITVTSEQTGIPYERLAELNRFQQEAKQSKAYEEFQKDKSFENFMKNPFGIMAEVTLESLVAMYRHGASRMAAGMAEGAALGSVVPGFGTIVGASTGMIAGSGLTSLNLEYSSKILETLSENGVDITNAESLKNAFSNEQLMNESRKAGLKKGIPVALFDMLSAGIAGKFVSKSAKGIMTTAAPTLGRKILGGVAELGTQAALGGAGEAAGQITEKGGIYDVNGIVMEMLGEPFGSVTEIVTGRAFEIAKRNEPLKTRDLVDIISKNDNTFINNNIDAHLAAGVINEEQAASLKNQVSYTQGMANKLPSELSINGKADIIDLLNKRNNIMSSVETLDDVFKKKANEEVKNINEQILNIYNTEQNAIKESTRKEQVGTEQSGVSQYQGVEGEQAQATTETNISNRPIGSQAQFQVGKKDLGVYKKETSAITNKINEIGGSAVELTADDAVNTTSTSNVSTLNNREGIVKTPNVVQITDFSGIPMMVTISDELTTGSIVNPATGNVISDLNGGVGFNYSEGNTDLAWAYTDLDTATDTLNYAKDIYQNNKALFDKLWAEGKIPQNHIPVAVVKMGTEAINSNEAVFRVFLDNLQSLPQKNLKAAYTALVKDVDANYKRLSDLSKKKKLSPSEKNALNGFEQIRNEYLKKNKSMLDVVSNISELNINTRPLITDRISSGEVGLLPAENRLKADKPVTKALMDGLPKSDIKKIHLGYIAEPLRDEAIKNVPARHVISFVGIDISKDAPVKTGNHKNYPYALSGQGLGVVENTAHISSVMPTAYGNIVSKITDVVAKEGTITPSQAVSRALPSGLSNLIFRNKTLATNDNISKLIGFLNLSFPNVTFFTDKQSFQDVLSSNGVKEYLKKGDVVYGITKDGNIYLNPEKATYNTAIHEMGHIWVDFIQNTRPELFAQGLKLVEGTQEFADAKARLGDNVFARKEALATLIGNKGETIADAAMKSQFKEWLVGVWKYLQEVFPSLRKLTPEQIENLSLQDFLGGALQDILSGKPISTEREQYTASESQFQKEKPSWFDDTEGKQEIIINDDFINENPDFIEAYKQYLFNINKNRFKAQGATVLRSAIDDKIKGSKLGYRNIRNIIVGLYKATPKSKANIKKTIANLTAVEKINSLFTDKAKESSKEDLRKKVELSNDYNKQEKDIIFKMIDDIIPNNVFNFIESSNINSKNYYEFATNLLKSKQPSAFIHEVGHWGFFNILSPEERIEFFKYSAERFAKGETTLEQEQALGKPFKVTRQEPSGDITQATAKTNASEDFMEYFAEQFRQYYVENKLTDEKFRTLFQKISLFLDNILKLFREASYNKELVKYFDKIIDARPKQETGIVKVSEAQPIEPERGIIKTGGEISTEQPIEEPAGLPEKKKYDWEDSKAEKLIPGETMIKTSTGRYVAVETMNGQKMDMDRKMTEIEKAKPSFYKKFMGSLRTAMIDNQAKVLSALANIGRQGQLVKAYLLTRNSASSTATILADKAINEIYGDISKKKMFNINGAKFTEYQLFNQMIGYQRVISIQKQMNEAYKAMINAEIGSPEYNINKQRLIDNNMIDANGEYLGESLDVEFAMGQVTATQARALLYEIRESIGEDAFAKLMNSSEKYSKHFNDMMKSRLDAGLISQGTYDHLSKYFYAPTRYISDVLTDPILSMTEPSTSYAKDAILKMKKLAGGSENLNVSDYEGLLRAVTYASEYSIAENRATNRFYDLVSTNKAQFEANGIRLGTRLVPIEPSEEAKFDVIDENVKAIQEGKKTSKLELPSGQKQLPYKGIQKAERGMQKAGEMGIEKYNAPTDIVTDENGNKFRVVQEPLKEGEDYIKTYFNGQRYDIIVPAWFASQWYNRNTITNKYVTGTTSWVSKLTGSNLLRVVATGINPVFGVAQLIPDTISAYASTLEERKLPILIDYPIFFVKVLAASKDIQNKSKDFQEAVQYGATTNFYNGGMVSFERGIMGEDDKSLEKVIEKWNVPFLKQYVIGSKKITETTEQMSKVALYKSIRDSKINQFKQENNREPNSQELEDIKIEAGAMARSTADFHRKGVLGGELNKIVPYLNAGIQVQRAVLTSAKENPTKMLSSAFEFVAYGALLTLSALGMGDDDELKEKKRKAYLKLSDFDRDNRVLLYFVESKEKFISVKIPEFLVPLHSLQRRMVEREYLENKSLTSKDAHEISRNVADAFPLTQFVNYEKVISRNPAAAAYSKLVNNRDPYRQEEVVPYEKATKDYLEGAEAGKKRAGKIYQSIGKAARNPFLPEGISPKRLESAASSVPFQSNPFSGAIMFGIEAATSEKDLFEERYGKSTAEKILKSSGLTDRYFKEGSKINQNIKGLSMENVKNRGEFKNSIAEILLPRFDSAVTKMTNPEAFKKVRSEFIKGEYQQMTPEEKQIARSFIEGELKSKAKTSTKDNMVLQIVKMEGSDAKVEGIVETLNTIKVSEDSKVKFIRDLVDAGLVSSSDFQKTLNVRGRETLNNGQKNEYYEPQVGYIRDQIKKYIQEKRAAKLK